MQIVPHTQELWLLSGSRCFCFHLQTVDVSNRDDCSGHVPWQTHEGANHQQSSHPEQIQVVSCPFLVQTSQQARDHVNLGVEHSSTHITGISPSVSQ